MNMPFVLALLFLPCFERQGCGLPEVTYAFADALLLIPGSPESVSVAPDWTGLVVVAKSSVTGKAASPDSASVRRSNPQQKSKYSLIFINMNISCKEDIQTKKTFEILEPEH